MPGFKSLHLDEPAGAAGGNGEPKSVLIVDVHPIMRDGLRRLLSGAPGLSLCGEAGSLTEARRLVDELRPDLVLLDSELSAGDFLEFVRDLRSQPDAHQVVVLCGRSDPGAVEADALRRGASASVSKRSGGEELLRVIQNVLRGRRCFSPEVVELLLRRRPRPRRNGS